MFYKKQYLVYRDHDTASHKNSSLSQKIYFNFIYLYTPHKSNQSLYFTIFSLLNLSFYDTVYMYRLKKQDIFIGILFIYNV